MKKQGFTSLTGLTIAALFSLFIYILIFFICLQVYGCKPAHSSELIDNFVPDTILREEALLLAIYRAEGGASASVPFGIFSITCRGFYDCQNIARNTVRNNLVRYESYGKDKYKNYIEFLGSRYAPIGVANDPSNLNQHWVGNVSRILEELL